MDPLKPVRPGDPLKIQSATWNRILDAARTHQQSRGRTGANPLLADALAAANLVLVQWPGADLAAFSVVTPNGMAIEPDSESLALAAQRRPVFVGQAPTATTDTPIIVVDPIATDGIGRAAIGGVVPCRINVLDTDHEYAEPSPAITDYLVSASTGPARILWREGGTGEQWGVVNLDATGSGCWCGDYWTFAPSRASAPGEAVSPSSTEVIRATVTKIPAGPARILFANIYLASTLSTPPGPPDYATGGAQLVAYAKLVEVDATGVVVNGNPFGSPLLPVIRSWANIVPIGGGGYMTVGNGGLIGTTLINDFGQLSVTASIPEDTVNDRYYAWQVLFSPAGSPGWNSSLIVIGIGTATNLVYTTNGCTCEPIEPPVDSGGSGSGDSGSGGGGGTCCTGSLVGNTAEVVVPDGDYAGAYSFTWGSTFGGYPWGLVEVLDGVLYVSCNFGTWAISWTAPDTGGTIPPGSVTADCGPPAVLTFPGTLLGSTGDITVTT